jgi:hypothetical protein
VAPSVRSTAAIANATLFQTAASVAAKAKGTIVAIVEHAFAQLDISLLGGSLGGAPLMNRLCVLHRALTRFWYLRKKANARSRASGGASELR